MSESFIFFLLFLFAVGVELLILVIGCIGLIIILRGIK